MTSPDLPHYDDIRHRPILTDDDAVRLLGPLLGTAIRRQVWVMFLDERARPLPLLMPMTLAVRPGTIALSLGLFLAEIGRAEGAGGVVVAFERRGGAAIREADRAWLRAIRFACVASGLPFRGPVLCHSSGLSSVPSERYDPLRRETDAPPRQTDPGR